MTDSNINMTSADMSTGSVGSPTFLEKVMRQGQLDDLYDARDVAEVVFRTMRDLMTTDAADRVAVELNSQAQPGTANQALSSSMADLWQDTNPLVAFLSRVRPPLQFDDETFLFRISQEAGLPKGVQADEVILAVFNALKAELSRDRQQEVARVLPGFIGQIWHQA
jgi:uncharacterized protein (DUF2267 family)